MSTSTIAPSQPTFPASDPEWIPSRLYRMTVDEYEAMVESGGLKSRNGFHLINGYLVAKMTQSPPHRVADELCGAELGRVVPAGRYHVAAAKPVRLPGRDSEPEPDRCIVRGTIRDYEDHHPAPDEIALVVEVADSSLADDRTLATKVYGPAGIRVYWIVNLVDRQVEVYTDPDPLGYCSTEVFREGQSIPVVIDGQPIGRIAVADILPSRPAVRKPGG
jgi:Uma2 family endonuclease